MRITTIKEAKALMGTVWERDGLQREITRVERLSKTIMGDEVCGDVFWKRPGGNEREMPVWLPYFNNWLSKARKVK